MVIHWRKPVPGWLLFTAIALICFCACFLPPENRPASGFESESITSPADTPYVNDSLPHYKYKQIKDSLDYLRIMNDYFYGRSGSSINNLSFGMGDYSLNGKKDYFLILSGYDHDENIEVINKTTGSVLIYPVWDKDDGKSRSGHLENKAISIKYREEKERWEDKVYVSAGRGFGLFLTVSLYALILMTAVAAFYFVLFIPFRSLKQLKEANVVLEMNHAYQLNREEKDYRLKSLLQQSFPLSLSTKSSMQNVALYLLVFLSAALVTYLNVYNGTKFHNFFFLIYGSFKLMLYCFVYGLIGISLFLFLKENVIAIDNNTRIASRYLLAIGTGISTKGIADINLFNIKQGGEITPIGLRTISRQIDAFFDKGFDLL